MEFIDTHSHLYVEDFNNDLDIVIEKCKNKNVSKVILPSIDESYTKRMISLKNKYPNFFYLMLGIHPSHIDSNYKEKILSLENLLKKNEDNFIGIGEIGVDLYWKKDNKEIQIDAFRLQIDLAKKNNLPINIHCRNAFDEVIEVLREKNNSKLRGIFHCFSGSKEQAEYITKNFNMKLGIGGVVTFKNSKLGNYLKNIDIKNIVLETDSPYLAPTPHRGKRNDSSYIPLIAEKLVDIYQISIEEIASITTQNAKEIFKI